MKKLPIGIQDFKKLVEGDYIYVDKTKFIYELASSSTPYFISRPRRFGKSLTVSTFFYLFKGEKELFEGTYIYDKWEWKEYPVIKISMTEINSTDAYSVERTLLLKLERIYEEYGLKVRTDDIVVRFSDLVYELSKREKVVILIDEYDKPILDHIMEPEIAKKVREILRLFYSTIKDLDPYLRFVFITGISKFTKAGIFSSLNNLNDITIDREYSQMMGYTQEELERYFEGYINKVSEELRATRDELLEKIKHYYNGFSFDGENFVYNPFSILNFFSKRRFDNYWFESGAPSFLVEYIRENKVKIDDIIGEYVNSYDLTTYEIENAPPSIFFVQSGYLTFKDRNEKKGYLLDFPNKEVKDSFSKLIMLGTYGLENKIVNDIRDNIIDGLEARDFGKVFEELKRLFTMIPYNLFGDSESYYHSVILTLLYACGLDVKAEEVTNLGRSDIVLEYGEDVYVIELKKATVEECIRQIKEKGYYEKYVGRKVNLVGIAIDEEKRNLGEYSIERI